MDIRKLWLEAKERERDKGQENYYDKLHRISNYPDSRLFMTDHHSRHHATYNLVSMQKIGWLRIEVRTLSEMEVINATNPPCVICHNMYGKIRGLLHNRPEVHEETIR